MKTITVGAYEAKTHLASLLAKVERGDQVIITKHDRPIAKLCPMKAAPTLTRAQVLQRLGELAKEVKPGRETAKELITAGRKL